VTTRSVAFRPAPTVEPPRGSDWDAPLDRARLLFLDLELTGLDPTIDRVIEVGAELVVGGRLAARVESLVRPDDGRFGNERIHGIREADLSGAPTFGELWPALEPLLEEAVLVAHGASFDAEFLRRELGRLGRSIAVDTFLDTVPIARRVFPGERHSLTELARRLALPAQDRHRAGGDVATLRDLFAALCAKAAPATARELYEVGRAARGPSAATLELLRAAAAAGAPVLLTHRRAAKPTIEVEMVLTSVPAEVPREIPGAQPSRPLELVGYLLPSRGRIAIRLDRVVAARHKPS
jgi:DNA polymerase-3 subunit epsilon